MSSSPELIWQPSLFATGEKVDVDGSFSLLSRIDLDQESWVDHAPEWVAGADHLFEEILTQRAWQQRSRRMYDKRVLEPRLTAPWTSASGEPLEPRILETIRLMLSDRYRREIDSVGFNLYRDGRDSVAWHADRIAKEIEDPIVALISLGEPRKFLLRPKGGGSSRPSCSAVATSWSPVARPSGRGSTAFRKWQSGGRGSALPTGTGWTSRPTLARRGSRGVAATSEARQLRTPWLVSDPPKGGALRRRKTVEEPEVP